MLGELAVQPATRAFQQARAAPRPSLRQVVPAGAGSPGDPPGVRWLEFTTESGPPVRLNLSSPAAVPVGLARPPWPSPAECYLAEFSPPAPDWALGSDETGVVHLDPAAIVSAVADALLAVGVLPPDSPVLADLYGKLRDGWRASSSTGAPGASATGGP